MISRRKAKVSIKNLILRTIAILCTAYGVLFAMAVDSIENPIYFVIMFICEFWLIGFCIANRLWDCESNKDEF